MEYRTLDITLQSARNLNNVSLFSKSKMGVYAVVSISGGDKSSRQKTRTPVDTDGEWNFQMSFWLDEEALQTNRLSLDLKLVCERAMCDKEVGGVSAPIKELFDYPVKAGEQFVSYQVGRKGGGKPKGQLSFSYKFSEKIVPPPPTPIYYYIVHTYPRDNRWGHY